MPKVEGEYLDFDDVWNKFDKMMDWLQKLTSSIEHYSLHAR